MKIHVVRPGESVYAIARQYGVTMQYIISRNDLHTPNRLTPGQTLVIPEIGESYTVRRGDTLGNIAEKNNTTVMRLWQLNPQLNGTDRIQPGMQLTLRLAEEPTGQIAVNGYAYPNIDAATLRRTLPYLTFLSVFSGGFDSAGRVMPPQAELPVRMARQYGVLPVLVLTTLDENGQFSGERADALLRDAGARKTLLISLPQQLEAGNWGGVDIDFEYVPPEDAALYAAFVTEMRATLTPLGYPVFVSLAPKTSAQQRGLLYEAHDYAALGAAADQALLMTYEWGYALSAPMAVAPIDKVEPVVAYAVSAVAPNRLLMGIPNYGYTWKLPYEQGARAQSIGNVQAVDQAIRYGAPIRFDDRAQSPYYHFWRDRSEYETWFEDARSVRAKLALAGEYGLAGISIWNIMRYFPQLYLVLLSMYRIEKRL